MIDKSENDVFLCKNRITHSGYNALYKRNDILEEGESKYIENKLLDDEDQEISNYTIENLKDFDQPLIEKFEILNSGEEVNGNKLYVKPFLYYDFEENPFKQKSRLYPVDFGYLRKYNYTIIFNVPISFTSQKRETT